MIGAASWARAARAAQFLLVLAVAEVDAGIFFSAFSADFSRSVVRVYNPTSSSVSFALYVVNDRPNSGSGQCTRTSGGNFGCGAGGGTAPPGVQINAILNRNGIRHFDRNSMLYLVVIGNQVADVIGQQG